MKNAIIGYGKIIKESGLKRAIWSFYSYYYTKYKLKSARSKGNFLVNTHGCPLYVIPNDDGLSSELLVFGSHERDTTDFVSNYLKKDMICVDIGANIGYYSILYSKIVGPNGKVISVEPSPVNYEYLNKNLNLQNNKNFQIFNCACGDKEGNVRFHVDNRGNKCFVLNENEQCKSPENVITVPVQTIEKIVNETNLSKIDFLKMDVEGYEWIALQGGWKIIKKFKPTIQIEIHHKRLGTNITQNLLLKFKEEGYEVIFHDIDGDEGTFFKRKNFKNYSIDDFINLKMIKKHQRSFKVILEYIKK